MRFLQTHRPYYFLFLVLSFGLSVVGAYLATGSPTEMLKFNLVHFYLNYQELGFIRRGFEGTLFYFFSLNNKDIFVTASYLYILSAIVAFWSWVLANTQSRKEDRIRNIVFLLSPALFLHYGYDLGRPDTLHIALLIASLFLISKNYYFLSALPAVIAILIHEVFIFSSYPVLFAFSLYHLSNSTKDATIKEKGLKIGPIVFMPMLAYLIILFLGKTNLSPQEASAVLNQHLDTDSIETYYLFATSIKWNIGTSILNFWGSLAVHVYQIVGLLLYFLLFCFFIDGHLPFQKNKYEKLLILSCFVPAFLVLIAIDKGRWFSMAISNLCIVYAYLQMRLPSAKQSALQKYRLYCVVLLGILLGPMTVTSFNFASCLDFIFIEEGHIKWRNGNIACQFFRSL